MWRIALTLLVALNLTFICWGHDELDHHTEIHLTFLGEPEHEAHGVGSTTYPSHGRLLVPDANLLPERALVALPVLLHTQIASLAATNSQGGHSVETMSIVLVLGAANISKSSRYLSRAERLRLRPQSALPPPIPPPKSSMFHLVIA